jgi:methylenetetrahydrofolate reductase (NADH)
MDKVLLQNFVRNYSIETTIKQARHVEQFSDAVPAGTRIYIPHTPGTHFQETVDLAARLRREAMEPVPHIVARRFENLSILDDFLGRLAADAGIKQILIVAGDIPKPAGLLNSSAEILESSLLEKHGIRTIGVAGYPEGHPGLPNSVLREALKRKAEFAQRTNAELYIVTQFTFSGRPVIEWEVSHSPEIGGLPIIVGLPGLATAKTLLKYAIDCGVGASLQAFSKRYASLTKLLTVSAPDETIVDLVQYKNRTPQSRIRGVHFFPFGGFKRTADWANKIVAGDFEITGQRQLRVDGI